MRHVRELIARRPLRSIQIAELLDVAAEQGFDPEDEDDLKSFRAYVRHEFRRAHNLDNNDLRAYSNEAYRWYLKG